MPEALAVAVAGGMAAGPDEAAPILAVLSGPGDPAAVPEAGRALGLRVWCVHGKGRGTAVGAAAVREVFRGAGLRDIKACAVSGGVSATLYRPPA